MKAKKEEKQREIDRKIELERLAQLREEKKKRNIIHLVIGFITLLASIFLWPILLPISLIALWYFTKKKPNDKFKKYAKNMTIVNALGLVLMFTIAETDDSVDVISDIDTVGLVEDVEADETEAAETLKAEAERKERAQEIVKERKDQLTAQKEKREQNRKEREAIAEANPNKTGEIEAPNEPVEVPADKEEVNVNANIPRFSNQDITSTEVYHRNGPLDSLGRVTAANTVVGVEIMPAKQRDSIGHHEPTGWSQASYANIDSGGWLYNRSHLIGHQLTGNDDYANLMTGTRSFNMRMLEYENFVAHYVETTENHVRYRVTPVFEGNNLIASGVYLEGFSIEDNGEGLMFNIYIPNTQPGVTINYADVSSVGQEGPARDGEIQQYSPHKKAKATSEPNPAPAPKPAPAPVPEAKPVPAPVTPAYDLSEVDTDGNGKVTIQEAKDAGYKMPIFSDYWLYKYMDDRNNNGMVGE